MQTSHKKKSIPKYLLNGPKVNSWIFTFKSTQPANITQEKKIYIRKILIIVLIYIIHEQFRQEKFLSMYEYIRYESVLLWWDNNGIIRNVQKYENLNSHCDFRSEYPCLNNFFFPFFTLLPSSFIVEQIVFLSHFITLHASSFSVLFDWFLL